MKAHRDQIFSSAEAFRVHTLRHIARVVVLGRELLRLFPEEFPLLDVSVAEQFLSLHDQSKVNTSPGFLARHELSDRENPIFEDLFAIVGHWDSLDERGRAWAESLKSELNRVDDAIAHEFLVSQGWMGEDGKPTPEGEQLLYLEMIVDSLDTVMDPLRAKEFGHDELRIGVKNATTFHSERDFRLAHALESFYLERAADSDDGLFD